MSIIFYSLLTNFFGVEPSPKCPRLIEAMQCYHYSDQPTPAELPQKDGTYDHPIDALRYFFINHERPIKTAARCY